MCGGLDMRAMMIEQYGDREKIVEKEIPLPTINEDDVLVEVHAASVNPVDIAIREGYFQNFLNIKLPFVLGWDVAGTVSRVGSNITRFKEGDKVFSYPDLARNGSYAEYIAISEKDVSHMPTNLSFIEAASIPLVGLTAWRSLVDHAKIKSGDKVLILGGSGGVGSFAVQLAKNVGAYVAATTSTKNISFVKELGADLVIDYTTEDFSNIQSEYDIVFDTVGRKEFLKAFSMVKEGGVLVTIASSVTADDYAQAKTQNITIESVTNLPCGERLTLIKTLLEEGKIKPVIGNIFDLDQVKEAHQLSESKRATGKIVLKIKA